MDGAGQEGNKSSIVIGFDSFSGYLQQPLILAHLWAVTEIVLAKGNLKLRQCI